MLLKDDVHTVRDLIDRQAEARRDQGVLRSPETGQGLTFKELRDQLRQLCGQFRGMGLAPGDKIAFLMDNGLFTAQLFLATMYGGFVTVPLNVRAGVSQLSYTLENCDAKLVLVGRPYEGLLKDVLGHVRRQVEVVSADADSGLALGAAPMPGELPRPRADDAAMLMYTSGSTGQPKGAIHTHRSILAHGRNSVEAHKLTPADRSLLVLPLYHINAECVTLIPTLLSGGSVVLPHGFVVSEFWNLIEDERCTWSAVVPTIISQLLDWKDPKADSRAAAFARIRFLRSSSAPLSPSLHQEFIDKFKLPLIQAMGSSEAGNVFSNPVPPGVNKIGSPGLPWGFEAKIVDRDGAELPAGEPGEVWLRGDGMMQGYYKDPTGTAAALDAAGWLHTGDLAYRDADGYFFVIGRSKELIIKGGVNIAPKQIDEILETHPAVLEAAAVGVPDRYVGEDLVAFAVLRQGMRCDELELLSFCESHLGYFKTPTRVHFVTDLPKGPSGKVQRLRLVEEAERLAATSAPPVKGGAGASATTEDGLESADALPLEQIIADIWAELLGAPQIGPDSNFFALGGQSLQAIQCLSRLREKTQILLSLSDVFENATVTHLAALVRRRLAHYRAQTSDSADQSHADLQPIPVRDLSLPCPLSPAQERIWFMEQIKGGEPAYNEAEAVRLKGKLDVAALERAFNVMIDRHEILRTTIEALDGKRITVIHDSFPLQFKKISLRHFEPNQRDAELAQLLIDEPRLPYRMEAEPAVRVTIVEMGNEDHAVILMMHHIICDSASLGILWRELASLYEADVKGEPSALPPLPIQYGDFAVWQRQPRQQEQFAEDIAFWAEKLRGAPPLLDQPTDRPRPPIFSFRGTKRQFAFDAGLADDLRRMCRQHQTSLFTVFAATLNTVMHRYTGQDDILIGIPIAARERPEVRPLIGFLLDTHVLRTNLGGDPTFRALMAAVQQDVANVYSHRAVPFDQIVSALQPERNLSYSPLIQVMLNWRDRDDQPQFIGLPGMQTEALLAQPKIAKFDLALMLTDTGNEIALEVEYSTDLFNDDRIERLVGHMNMMLKGVVADVEQRLSALPLLSAPERHQLLYAWNATQAVFPADRCVHELFEEQAAKTPDAVALVFEDRQLSYAELNARANQLAHHLIATGLGPEARVAIVLERSLEMVVAMLAILKAGGAFVPIDPAYPAERLSFMIEDSTPDVLLTQRAVLPLLGHLPDKLPILTLDDTTPPWAARPATNPEPASVGLAASNLAYVIYTSGSTGRPKGVLIEHGALAQHCTECQEFYELTPEDRVLQFASPSFDAAIEQILPPLLSGARVVLRDAQVWTAGEFQQKLAELGLTVINLPPAYWQQLTEQWANAVEPVSAHAVRLVIIGGDAMSVQTLRFWQKTPFNSVRLLNAYGPTEAVITATSFEIPASEPGQAPFERLPIGRPRGARQIYVLDRWGQLAPVGVAGELHIGGTALARGYRNRAELTDEKFIADPFSDNAEARLYRTGDLARYLPDGNIEFLGRVDHQVKIRGFRIELGEIEARLQEHAAIREAVVLLREDVAGDKRLVAYYVALNHETIDPEPLRSYLAAALPEYMVPAAYVRLDGLPLTTNGKLDRRALPAPHAEAYARAAYEAPRGETETTLAAIWSELLGVERISRSDDFFELGGHSLLAISLIERMRRVGMRVSVRTLFATPTLADVAASVGNEADVVDVPPNKIPEQCSVITPAMLPLVQLTEDQIEDIVARVPGGAANVQDIYPLAPLQEGILFHHLMQVEGDPYLLVQLFSLDSRPRLDAYVQAIQAVVNRHDILRTAVFWEGLPTPVQVVWRNAPMHIEEIELAPEQGDAAEQLYARFSPRQFSIDVRQAPLLRLYIAFDITQQRWLVMQLSHHIVGDHTSLDTMRAELQAHLLGQESRLPKPLPFRNLVAQARFGVNQHEHEAFFRNMLADIDEPTTPFGLLDVYGDGGNIDEARMRLDADLAHRLRANARRLGVTVASLCHLAWAQILAKASGREDVVFGTVLFGRMQGGVGADRVMGLFNNTLPVRISTGEGGVVASVRKTHAVLAELLRHEHASLSLAQRCSAVPAPAPLFSAIFNYRHSADADQAPSKETLRAWEGIRRLRIEERTNYPLVLSVNDLGEGFSLTAQTLASIGPERVCAFMETALDSLVRALEHAPDRAVRTLPVLPASERHRQLYEWNATARDFPAEQCVDRLFEQQAERTPDAVAVIFKGQKLTYAALNARANRLAQTLIEWGVQPADRVATLLERSIDLIVAQLAILKVGAAYVPLDPQAPAMRHAWIVEDCAATLIMTDVHTDLAFAPAAPVLRLGDGIETAEAITANPDRPGSSLRVAYVMYTSGSTGTPKGVLVPHRAVTRLVINNEYAVIGADDRVAFAANPAFDASTFELWAPLLNGGTVVVIDHDTVLTPQAFMGTLREERINVLWLTVGLFNQLAEALEPIFAQFKVVITGGDVLDARLMAKVWANPLQRPQLLLNAYGPTETTTFATTYRIGSSQEESASIPIGRPISNARIYLLDPHGEPVPLGAVGEIYIGGEGVALGYLNRPDLTAERFLVDRFSDDPDARMYRTGDLARYLPDGNLVFVGRNDNQVKIRGFRIELGEIEGRLAEHPSVREGVVLALANDGGKQLVAYVVADHDDQLASRLREHLVARLPEYMVPAAFVRLDAFPLTLNGKLDRRALPSPDDDAYARAAYEAPQGETETVLAAIWSDLLGLERISRNDNFFNLGGHSFLALRVISEIKKRLNLRVSVPAFFLSPTIAGLEKELAHDHQAQTKPRVATLRAGATGLPIYFMGARPEEFRLAQMIGGNRRLFTVDAPLLASWLAAFKAADIEALPTIEQLGAHFGEVLAKHAGSSPCVIAGYSLGGKIAFEAARVLQRAGGNVAFVLILDTRAFTWSSYTLGPALASMARIWRGKTQQATDALARRRLSTALSESWVLVRWLLSRVPNSVKHHLDRVKNSFGLVTQSSLRDSLPSGYFDEEGKPIEDLLFNQFALSVGRLWRPRPLDAAGVFIRADNSENALPGNDPSGGWSGLFTRGLEIVQTAGDHHSMVTEENAAALARQMNLILDGYEAAQTARDGAPGNDTDQRVTEGSGWLEPAPAYPQRSVV